MLGNSMSCVGDSQSYVLCNVSNKVRHKIFCLYICDSCCFNNDYFHVRGGEGSLGPKSYLLLIWTFFGLVEQLLINLQLNGYSVIKYKLFFQSTLKSLVYFLRYCGSVYCITLFYSRIGFCNKKIVGYRQSLGACLVSFTFSRGQKGVPSPPPKKNI